MLYLVLKFLHEIGAAVLLGTGAGIAFFMLLAHLDGRPVVVAGVARIVVIADFLFTATAVVAQPVTGFWLALHAGYNLLDSWIVLSILLYLLTGAFWLPVVRMQMRMRDLADAAVRDGLGPASTIASSGGGSPSASQPLPRFTDEGGHSTFLAQRLLKQRHHLAFGHRQQGFVGAASTWARP